MKTKNLYLLLVVAVVATLFSACQKGATTKTSATTTTGTTTTVSAATVLSTGAIAITTTSALATTTPFATNDSIYMVGCYPPNGKKDSVAFSALPTAIGTYLTANYSGYTFVKAYKITDNTGAIINYIVVIKYNNNLVGLKFTTAGVFVAVLEQMAGADLGGGPGAHPSGPFNGRCGTPPDTIALSAIPAVVKTYFNTSYPADTLIHAAIAPDGSYVLISKDKVLYATDISTTGSLISRVVVPGPPAIHTTVLQAALPAAITTYLTATYPGYVFDSAFSVSNKTTLLEYDVFITANNTKYVVVFNASGVFVAAMVVH